MSCAAKTKDEQYLIQLFEMTEASGDWDTSFHMEEVGKAIGLSPRAVKTIVALLAQANFVKKPSKVEVVLTSRGIELVRELVG